MAFEIERKFLVNDTSYRAMACSHKEISQGYLNRDPERTVRVRIADNAGFITVKGRSSGATRVEFEYEVPCDDARQMLALCQGKVLVKTRWIVNYNDFTWEVDEFHGDREGLVVAEIELPDERISFPLPAFVGREVTGDPAFYNSML